MTWRRSWIPRWCRTRPAPRRGSSWSAYRIGRGANGALCPGRTETIIGENPAKLVIDLLGATSIDSSGLVAVTAPAMRCRRASIDVRLLGPIRPKPASSSTASGSSPC